MKITMQQIADAVGVSRGTVDRALHERGRIDPEVCRKILRTAEDLGYTRTMSPAKNKETAGARRKIRIGVITYLCHAGFMQEIKHGIGRAQEELQDWGVEVLLRESESVNEEEQLRYLEELLDEGIDALAIMPIDTGAIRQRLYEIGTQQSLPVVMFNSDLEGIPRVCYVGMDNYRSGRTAAGLMHLLTGDGGRILVITGTFSNQLNNARVDGFAQELKASFPQMSIASVQSSFDSGKEVERIVEESMRNIPGIDGIFVVSSGQEGLRAAFGKLRLDTYPGVIAYDQTPKNEQLLQEGLVDFLIDQNGFVQGYRPLFILANAVNGNSVPEPYFEYTDISIKTKYNL